MRETSIFQTAVTDELVAGYPELSPTQIIPPPSAPLPLPPGPRASVVSEPSSAFEQLFASPSDSIHFGAPGSGTGTGTGPTQSTPNPFDVVLTRPILYAILAAWFDYIYCLIPLPDRMALHHDLEQRREERPGEEEWTAMVFAMIGSTIVQVPNQLIPVNPKDMRPLVKLCFDKANGLIAGRPTTRSVNRSKPSASMELTSRHQSSQCTSESDRFVSLDHADRSKSGVGQLGLRSILT